MFGYKRKGRLTIGAVLLAAGLHAQESGPWRSGILVDEFVYEQADFPSCHAATIAETSRGLAVAFFGGTHERHPDVEIRLSRYENGSWTAPESVADGVIDDTLRYPTWNPVLYQVPDGELQLYYKVGPHPSEWWGMVKTSRDGGQTWSSARKLPEGYIGPVKNKPVLLENGNLMSPSSKEGKGGWRLHVEISGDNGQTWRQVGPLDFGAEDLRAIQPSILDHGNGKLQMLARSRNRVLAQTWSNDYGETWSPLERSGLPNNNSGTDAVTLADGRHALVYNHVLPPGDLAKGPRTPLHLSISKDGKKWYAAAILEDSPISQYSYPSIIQTKDGMLHVVYTWRRERIKHAVIDPGKLKLKRIRKGVWPKLKGYVAPAPIVEDANGK